VSQNFRLGNIKDVGVRAKRLRIAAKRGIFDVHVHPTTRRRRRRRRRRRDGSTQRRRRRRKKDRRRDGSTRRRRRLVKQKFIALMDAEKVVEAVRAWSGTLRPFFLVPKESNGPSLFVGGPLPIGERGRDLTKIAQLGGVVWWTVQPYVTPKGLTGCRASAVTFLYGTPCPLPVFFHTTAALGASLHFIGCKRCKI
jgi:hypothetical protein